MKKIIVVLLVLIFMAISASTESCYEEFIMNATINEIHESNGDLFCCVEYNDEQHHVLIIDGRVDQDWVEITVTRNGEETFNEIIHEDDFNEGDDVTEFMWLLNGLIYDGWL